MEVLMAGIRKCMRPQCQQSAVSTMTYSYAQATAVVGPLAPFPQPGTFDLCAEHALTVTVPTGWELVRLITDFVDVEPSTDDLTALADAIREASKKEVPAPQPAERRVQRPATDIQAQPGGRGASGLNVPLRPRMTIIDGGEDGVKED